MSAPTPSAAPPAAYEPEPRWVPVDRRWFGLDRVTIVPAVVVLALWVVMSMVIPAINSATNYREQVAAGDIMQLSSGISFVPEPGWGIVDGVRLGDEPAGGYPDAARIVYGDASFAVVANAFEGEDDELLDNLQQSRIGEDTDVAVGSRETVVTDQGFAGVTVELADPNSSETLAAFVIDGVGIGVRAVAPATPTNEDRTAVSRMIRSVRHLEDRS